MGHWRVAASALTPWTKHSIGASTSPAPTIPVPGTLPATPVLIWGMLLVAILGFGPMAGVIALTLLTVSFAGKLMSEQVEAIAQGQAFALDELLEESFSAIVSAMNTNIGGVHVFSGGRSDVPPVTGSQISDLLAAASVSDLFQNDQLRPSAKIGQSTLMEYGLLADEVGQEVFQVFKNIAAFSAGPSGPLSGQLNTVQTNFLKAELANMDTALDSLRVLVARNGTRQNSVDSFLREHEGQEAFLEVLKAIFSCVTIG